LINLKTRSNEIFLFVCGTHAVYVERGTHAQHHLVVISGE